MKSLFLLFLFPFFTFSQEIIFKNITVNDGLPSSEVYCIEEDNLGYIWIGTDNGLVKYDGKKFDTYSGDSELANNTILDFIKAADGKLWLATLSGDIYYLYNGEIIYYPYTILPYRQKKNLPIGITLLGKDDKGISWLREHNQLNLYKEVRKDTFKLISIQDTNHPRKYYILKQIGNNKIISRQLSDTNKNEKVKLDIEGGFIIKIPFVKDDNAIVSRFLFKVLANKKMIGFNNKGKYFVFTKDSILEYGDTKINGIINIYEDRGGNIWFITNHGIFLFELGNLMNEPQMFLENHSITNMVQDNEGNYWFTDQSKGLHRTSSIYFRHYIFSKYYKQQRIAALKVRNEELWFSTIKGEIWNIDSQLKPNWIYSDNGGPFDFYPFEVFLDGTVVSSKMDFSKNGIVTNITEDRTFTNKCMSLDKNNIVNMGLSAGFSKFSLNDGLVYSSYRPVKNQVRQDFYGEKFGLRVNAILNEDNKIWLGTTSGLILNHENKFIELGRKSPLLSYRVMAIKKYLDDQLIIGTKGAGIIFYNKNSEKVIQFTKKEGLNSNSIKSIFVNKKKIYIGTNKGLNILLVDSLTNIISLTNYNIDNGLSSNEIEDIAYYKGKMWLATNNGLLYFDEKKLTVNEIPPPIYITSVVTSNASYLSFDSTIVIDDKDRNLTITYNGVGFRAGKDIRYKYYLEGFIEDTIFTSSNEVRYTNLSPGQHTFFVWAMNEDGFWSQKPASFSLNIPHVFIETGLFLFLSIFFFILIFLLILLLIVRRNKSKLKSSIQTTELKQQALTALMNPHFIYNSLSAIQHFINIGDNEKSNQYLTKFSKLVRLNLNSVRNGRINLEDEIERLKLYLEIEKIRFGEKLTYEIEIDNSSEFLGIQIPSMILQPFVENAIWHGILPMKKMGKVKIKLSLLNEKLVEVIILDNGIGIFSSQKKGNKKHHTSLSMEITKERMDLLMKSNSNSKIEITEISEKNGGGTKVYLKIPILE